MSSMDLRNSIPPFLDVRCRSRSRSGSFVTSTSSTLISLISTPYLGSYHSHPTTCWLKPRTSLDQHLRGIELEKAINESSGESSTGMNEMIYKFYNLIVNLQYS